MAKEPTQAELDELRGIITKILIAALPSIAKLVEAAQLHGTGEDTLELLEQSASGLVEALAQANREGLLDR